MNQEGDVAAAAPVRIRVAIPGVDPSDPRKRLPVTTTATKSRSNNNPSASPQAHERLDDAPRQGNNTRAPTKASTSLLSSQNKAACVDVGSLAQLSRWVTIPEDAATREEHSGAASRGHNSSAALHPAECRTKALQSTSPPVLHTPELLPEQAFVAKVEKTSRSRRANQDAQQSFVPVLSSVPSSFRKAKPRVYRSRFTPGDAAKRQTECNVVTTGASDVDGNGNFASSSQNSASKAGSRTSNGKVHAGPSFQETVAVVSLAELEDESVLMLDFHASARRRRVALETNVSKSVVKNDADQFNVRFLAWSDLSDAQRRLELMVATKSRCVREAAARDAISIPSLEDFESRDVKVQLSVHAFSRWFTAMHNHHQWVRERFLLEELTFAATDPEVHSEMTQKGIPVPSLECVGAPNSREWHEFVLWYSGESGDASLTKERLESRTQYLTHRLRVVQEVKQKLSERHHSISDAAEETVFVFENFQWALSNESEDVMSWENTSQATRAKEVALALLDPDIQIAAMMDEIELPDLSGASLEDFDLLALAGKFVPWWTARGNKARLEFLNREVDEASADVSIQNLLSQELGDGEIGAALSSEDFLRAYFQSDEARLTFLKRKLFYMKRKSRIASVAKYGKLPGPIVFETLPRSLSVTFQFPSLDQAQVDADSESEEVMPTEDAEQASASDVNVITDNFEPQPEQDGLSDANAEEELRCAALETELMLVEDELSREFNAQMMEVESDDDDDDSKSLTPPKRTDFSRSYFFGNLPTRFQLPSSNWHSGSGIDNGDEELEEEEELEQERERQRLLDQQEAERLAEEERRAERARMEKEKEDKALQMKRVRQLELRKVLIYQSELETKRREEQEAQRVINKMKRMRDDEARERARRESMAKEQADMESEDRLGYQVRQEIRDAVVRAKRSQLNELALMDAEDHRSALVQDELAARERDENERRLYLTELYSSFEPFFASSNEPSEEFLPSIQRRCMEREERRRRARLKVAPYAVPYADSLVIDEIEQEPYLARDSRKFNVLMGLPVRSSQPKKRMHFPSEADICRLHGNLDADKDRNEMASYPSPSPSSSTLPVIAPHHIHQKSRQRRKKPQILDAMSRNVMRETVDDFSSLEMKEPYIKANMPNSTNQRPQAVLPFFRGNMVVRGEGKHARSKDYSYHQTG